MNGQSVVGQMEDAQAEMEQWTHSTVAAVQNAIGERPYGQEKMPERQQARQGALMYHDPNAWSQMIETHGAKPALEYAQRLTRLKDKYPEEFAAGQQAAGMMQPAQGGDPNGQP